MDRILITGGCGFVGSHLVRFLVEDTKKEIVVLDNLSHGSLETISPFMEMGRVRFVNADIQDTTSITRAMRDVNLVFHLAAQSNVVGANQDLEYSFSTNVIGTFNILRVACDIGVQRLIFTSSREVYGQPDNLPVSESSVLHARNGYGASKIAAEQYCDIFRQNYGLDVRVLRLANVYGDGDLGRVIPTFCTNAYLDRPLVVYGGSQVIDFVWIGDVIRALWDAALTPDWQGPVNVGSGTAVTVIELAHLVKRLTGRPDVPIELRPPRSIEVDHFVADVSRMRSCLGWAPRQKPLEYLPEVVEYYCRSVQESE